MTNTLAATGISSVRLQNRTGRFRTVAELTTLFDLFLVVVDGLRPRQLEALRPVVERIHRVLGDTDCIVGVLAVGVDSSQAADVVEPLGGSVAYFADPDGSAATTLGVAGAPALLWITTQPVVRMVVHGWHPDLWDHAVAELARKMAWTRPRMAAPGDPAPIDPKPFTILGSQPAATVRHLRTTRPAAHRSDGRDAQIAA